MSITVVSITDASGVFPSSAMLRGTLIQIEQSMRSMRQQRKTLMLRAVGYTVIEKWGCENKEDKKTNAELKAFLNNYEAVPPLEPRDSLFGGHTGATTLYSKAEPDEEILYQDFTSLYPWVNKYCEYPVGFPEAHLNPSNQDIHCYFRVALVDVLAPERLFHPVLPV